MDLTSKLEMIYSIAQTDTKDGDTCRDVLLSLWDDGSSHGCDLRDLLSLAPDLFRTVQQVLDNLYNSKQQLDQFMSTRQITVLDKIDCGKKAEAKDPAFAVSESYSKVER